VREHLISSPDGKTLYQALLSQPENAQLISPNTKPVQTLLLAGRILSLSLIPL